MQNEFPENIFNDLDKILNGLETEIIELRRYLHKHPEPSLEEFKTTGKISKVLEKAGINHMVAPSGRGVIANSLHQSADKRIALRADIDALRMQDEKTVMYRSSRNNLMHACGHDAHAAMLMGAVKGLSLLEKQFPNLLTWRAIFQPAEETATGALEMIDLNVMEDVNAIIALHVEPTIPAGQIGIRSGPLTAICEELVINIKGKGGHGARPHHTADPIAASAQLITSIYQNIPRSLDSQDPAVITVGVIQAGINPNVIPETAQLRGTIRTLKKTTSEAIHKKLLKIISGVKTTTDTHITLEKSYFLPSVNNQINITHACAAASEKVFGKKNMIQLERPSMGGEDFSHYLEHAPGCMLRLGTAIKGKPISLLHTPRFDIDESALLLGAKTLAFSVLQLSSL